MRATESISVAQLSPKSHHLHLRTRPLR
jgi:hypothetical protein